MAQAAGTLGLLAAAVLAPLPSHHGAYRTNYSSAGFSDSTCSASGATAVKVFKPHVAANPGTDNTGLIQGAIDAASAAGGGIVALPAGTFGLKGHLELRSNVELAGVGQGTILKAIPGFLESQGPQGGYPVITTAGASNITIADLTADQSGDVLDGNQMPQSRLAGYLIDVRN